MSLHYLPLTDEPQTAEQQIQSATRPEMADQTNAQSEEMEFSQHDLPLIGETQELLDAKQRMKCRTYWTETPSSCSGSSMMTVFCQTKMNVP